MIAYSSKGQRALLSKDGLAGLVVGLAAIFVVTEILLPFRDHASLATFALVLTVPVAAGVAVGGPLAGAASTVAGFLTYDFYFIPPYGTLEVGAASNWVALGVFALVGAIISAVVLRFQHERARALRTAEVLKGVAAASAQLIADDDAVALKRLALTTAKEIFGLGGGIIYDGDATLIDSTDPNGNFAQVILGQLRGDGRIGSIGPHEAGGFQVRSVRLATVNREFGVMVVWARNVADEQLPALQILADQLASALERATLREAQIRINTLEEVDRWRVSLLRTVSHDLLTPLAGIKTAVTALQEGLPALEGRDRSTLLATTVEQADRIIQLVTDLLNVNRIEAGALKLRYREIDLRRVVSEVVAAIDFVSIDAEVEITGEPQVLAVVDEGLIREVIWNLLENAVRHSPVGGKVEVGLSRSSEFAVISVSDQGVLPAAGDSSRMFDWFHHSESGGRSGLGLAIVEAFVGAHKGSVEVEADFGSTVFRVALPVAP